jgi:hypothetical protein
MYLSRRKILMGSAACAALAFFPNTAKAQGWEEAAAWVGEKLLEGAIAYVGGRILGSALGGVSISDVEAWIHAAVADLEAFVSAELRRQLDAKVMEQIRAEVSGMRTDMQQFASLDHRHRSGGKFLLERVDTQTAELIPLALNYQQALFIGFAAMAYRLYALTALFRLENDGGYILSAKTIVDDFIVKSNESYKAILNKLSPDVRIKINCWEDPGASGYPNQPDIPGSYNCDDYLDGQYITGFSTDRIAEEGTVRAQAKNFADAKLKPDVVKLMQRFDAVATTSFQKTIECYTAMCKLVHSTYKPPIEFPVKASLLQLVPTGTVMVPGATIIDLTNN